MVAEDALCRAYDVGIVDLDGVVYLVDDPVPHAVDAISRARNEGMRIVFVTNNASRTPQTVAARLVAMGMPADASDVVTAAAATARLIVDRLGTGARVLVVGGEGLHVAVAAAGLVVITPADAENGAEVDAVAQGYTPDLRYTDLAEAGLAIRRGALWVAPNADPTLPTPRGQMPGNGAFVAALRTATGVEPIVVGKPAPDLFRDAATQLGAHRPLVVGDRVDTDIAAAHAAGMDSLLVLTGVTGRSDLPALDPQPTYLGDDLRALLAPGVPG